MYGTRDLFIALNDVTLDARFAITQGKSQSFFVMNGYDLMMILSEAISLTEYLQKRVRLLERILGVRFALLQYSSCRGRGLEV